jgi:hypothetical protein
VRHVQNHQARLQRGLGSLWRVVASLLREPSQRIIAALVISALIHAIILWMPHLRLPSVTGTLPSLTVRFEYQPKPVSPPVPEPETVLQVSNAENNISLQAAAVPAEPVKAEAMQAMEKSADSSAFPKHVRLSFTVYQGKNLGRAGEMQHQLDINASSYSLKSIRRAAGMLMRVQSTQFSRGAVNERGLQPDEFSEERVTSGGKQKSKAIFDRTAQTIHFSTGADATLPPDAQDGLSFMYQLSQLSMHTEIIPLAVSDGNNLENYRIEIGREENLSTPMGELRTLHLRKMHVQDEPYFEIWLGLDYRLLPVKFRQVAATGEVLEEFAISDIRSSDY